MEHSTFPKVQILLSTYNGEKYILEQLDSLKLQDYPNFTVKIRDDGSKDSTPQIVEDYIRENKLDWELSVGGNIGVIKSFFGLLFDASDEADFYSFCDQDDVWKKDKISRAVQILSHENEDEALLYCSAYNLVDEKLNAFPNQYDASNLVPSFKGALFVNMVTGCTAVMNKKTRELITSKKVPNCVVHDWWLYLVASAFGKVIFDTERTIFYRMHGGNICGTSRSHKRKIINFLKMLRGKLYISFPGEITAQVREFSELYSSALDDEKIRKINTFVDRSLSNRVRMFFDSKFWRQSCVTNGHRVRFLFNSM